MSNMRHCPHCHCSIVVKFGVQNGHQRYKCKQCDKIWQNKKRNHFLYDSIWDDFALNDLVVDRLIDKYKLSDKTIRNILAAYEVPPIIPHGTHTVIAMDVTYFGRDWGLLIAIDANTGEGLYVGITRGYETSYDYRKAIQYLVSSQICPKACVIDGKKGVIPMLEEYDIIPQYCQFHQIKTVNSYLTRKPILEPNIKLRELALSITHVKAETFVKSFKGWLNDYRFWLNEKTRNPETGKLEYSHQKTRSAVNSLRTNLWYLYNYEFYQKYNIPNTNNRLEGINRALKYKLRHHSGATKELKTKIAISFLSRRTEV